MNTDIFVPLIKSNTATKHEGTKKKIYSYLLTSYLLILIPSTLFVVFIIQLISIVILWPIFVLRPKFKSVWLGNTLRIAASTAAFRLNPFWKLVIVKEPDYIPNHGKVIYMSNHLSTIDPFVISKVLNGKEAKFTYKSELKNVPIIGQILYLAQDIPVKIQKQKNDAEKHKIYITELMKKIEKVSIENDLPIFVFPEGTRGRQGKLQPFKDGFFRFAKQNNWTIVPFVLHGTQYIWPLGSLTVYPGTIYASIGDPLTHFEDEDYISFKNRVREVFISMILEMPKYNPETDEPLPHESEFQHRNKGILG